MPSIEITTPTRPAVGHNEGDAMSFDALAELRAAGNPIEQLTPAQQDVLKGLTPAEVATLNSVKARIDAVSSDVEGHVNVVGVGIF
jgi:hypothetical protein